jgi:LmbE family N-acetylglucosaminyl deacetylase
VLSVSLNLAENRPAHVLCVGAHCDDIEIGCGGTLLSLGKSHTDLKITCAIFSGNDDRQREARKSLESLFSAAADLQIVFHDFADGRLPFVGEAVKNAMEDIRGNIDPDLIFTHWEGDRHQDHRFLSEVTWNTFRDHLIMEFEIPKYDGDFGSPGVFCPLDKDTAERKVDHLMRAYRSQASKDWFTPDLFMSVLRIRGMEARADSGFAEGFYCRKLPLLP